MSIFAEYWWSRTGSNRRPPECHSGALPAELRPLRSASVDREDDLCTQAASSPADGLAGLLVDAALDDVRHILVLAQLGGVLDQAVVLLGLVLSLDDGLVLLDLDLLLGLFGLGLGAELSLGHGDALDRGDGGTGPGACAPRPVEDLEVE